MRLGQDLPTSIHLLLEGMKGFEDRGVYLQWEGIEKEQKAVPSHIRIS